MLGRAEACCPPSHGAGQTALLYINDEGASTVEMSGMGQAGVYPGNIAWCLRIYRAGVLSGRQGGNEGQTGEALFGAHVGGFGKWRTPKGYIRPL